MRLRHLGLSTAATVLALAGTGAPVAAEPGRAVPLVGVQVPRQVTVVEGRARPVTATVTNAGTAPAGSVVLRFGSDAHPVGPALGLRAPAGCGVPGCDVGDLAPGASRTFTFTLTPTGRPAELTSVFDVTVGGGEGVLGYASTVAVVRARGGTDLELAPIGDLRLRRGQAADVPVVVRNVGTAKVDAIGLVMVAEPGLQGLAGYRNCERLDRNAVVCLFDQVLWPGATFVLPSATPLRIGVAADAGGPYRYSVAVVAVGVTAADLGDISEKSGSMLRLSEADANARPTEDGNQKSHKTTGEAAIQETDAWTFHVSVDHAEADSAAVGASFRGAVGDHVSIQVGIRHEGATVAVPPGPAWFPTVRVTIPSSVRLTAVDQDCVPGTEAGSLDFGTAGTVRGRVYTCFHPGPGARLFTFTAAMTGTAGRPGTVLVDGGFQDTNRSNDRATIDVRPTATGEGGGLPVTGTPTAWLVAAGAVLLLLGLSLHHLAHRRPSPRRVRSIPVRSRRLPGRVSR